MYDYFPENVRNMLKYDFVFVSYCQENEKITANVNKLVKALRNDGINVMILSILVYTLFSRMFDLMQPPVVKHSIAVA